MNKEENEAVKWHRLMAEEKKQCRFYPECDKKPVATLTIDKDKYKVCLDCAKRFKLEYEKKLLTQSHKDMKKSNEKQ